MRNNLSSLPGFRSYHFQFPEVIRSVFQPISLLSRLGIVGCTADGKDVLSLHIPTPACEGVQLRRGLPSVIDRLLQQAISPWLSPKYECDFSSNSYGFRPHRNAHQAELKAQVNLNEGYTWIGELDLEKFFNRVNHDKLMHLLMGKIKDKRTLRLIQAYQLRFCF